MAAVKVELQRLTDLVASLNQLILNPPSAEKVPPGDCFWPVMGTHLSSHGFWRLRHVPCIAVCSRVFPRGVSESQAGESYDGRVGEAHLDSDSGLIHFAPAGCNRTLVCPRYCVQTLELYLPALFAIFRAAWVGSQTKKGSFNAQHPQPHELFGLVGSIVAQLKEAHQARRRLSEDVCD